MSGRFLKQCKDLTRVFPASTGELFLTDTGNHRILVLDRELQTKQVLRRWPLYALRHPYGVHGDGAGQFVIADTGNHKVLILDSSFQLLQVIGTQGAGSGEFSAPREARFGPGKALYVLDTMNSRIQVFRSPLDRLDDLIQSQAPTTLASGEMTTSATPPASPAAASGTLPTMDKGFLPAEGAAPQTMIASVSGSSATTTLPPAEGASLSSNIPETPTRQTGSDSTSLPNNDLPEEFEFADPASTSSPASDTLKDASNAASANSPSSEVASKTSTPSPASSASDTDPLGSFE